MANWKLHKYYRGLVLVMIKDRLNYLVSGSYLLSDSDTHSLLKIVTKSPSNAKMDNKQFLEFLEEVCCIGSYLGIYIPFPDEEIKMELLKEIVQKLENKIFPALKYLDQPINYAIHPHSKLSSSVSGNTITLSSEMFTDEHLSVVTTISGSLVEHTVFFEGINLQDINNALDRLIQYSISPIMSTDYKKDKISQKIKELNIELQAIEKE